MKKTEKKTSAEKIKSTDAVAAKQTKAKKTETKTTQALKPKSEVASKAKTTAKPKVAVEPVEEAKSVVVEAVSKPVLKKIQVAPKSVVQSSQKSPKKEKFSNPPVSHGTGRRKSTVARVWMKKGKGLLTVNGKDFKNYFDTEVVKLIASKPFKVCKDASSFDMHVNIRGGGKQAQADAVKLGIARALVKFNENLRPLLREHDLLTVDSRVKERKKYGQKAARRKFQFVKR